jgi:hypothetical protein
VGVVPSRTPSESPSGANAGGSGEESAESSKGVHPADRISTAIAFFILDKF